MLSLRALLPLALFALTACGEDKDTGGGGGGGEDTDRPRLVDEDEDGYGAGTDCDDGSAAISPGADELCNGIDDDCDGLVDEAGAVDGTLVYPDADGDGAGDEAGAYLTCEAVEGTVTEAGDCDDGNASRAPTLTESCDGIDNDCDGTTDEAGATGGLSAHPDEDGDGYGASDTSVLLCELTDGYVSNEDDCDDGDPDVNPTGREVCDDVDNDCDGDVDGTAEDMDSWYEDGDGDGYGLDDSTLEACDQPEGYASRGGDCDDDNARVSPGSAERCDDADNDCDGETDEDAVDATSWYYDTDGDGYGPDDTELTQCDDPGEGYVTLGGDCDEEDTEVNPGVEESWYDGWDADCDGASDYDQDGDGYVWSELEDEDLPTYDPGTGEIIDDGSETEGGDCDDENNRVHPGSAERCNDADDDCDGETDEDAVDARTWYTDADGDTYGDEETALTTCDAPTGDYIRRGGDCDDTNADVNPGEDETCDVEDGIDNDCDGSIDECVEYNWTGYYIVGEYDVDAGAWDCINYYSAYASPGEDACEACDFSLTVDATYEPGALSGSYDECDWADLEYWEEVDEFSSDWSFAYEPAYYDSPVAYYSYYGYWYPFAYFYYGSSAYGYDYLQWVFFAQYDSGYNLEAGLFFGYLY